MKKRHHILIGETPFCHWLGCAAGHDISRRAKAFTCSAISGAEARRMAARLQPSFRVPVRAVAGECPAYASG